MYEIAIGDRLHRVALEPRRAPGAPESRYTVRIGELVRELDVRVTELGLSIVDVGSGRAVDVAVTEGRRGEWVAELPRVAIAAEVDRHRFGSATSDGGADQGPQRIVAPMPGRVVRLLVKVGDDVAARQGLVVVEAMKMENELSSPRSGRVREIGVAEGTSVESGRLLVVVE